MCKATDLLTATESATSNIVILTLSIYNEAVICKTTDRHAVNNPLQEADREEVAGCIHQQRAVGESGPVFNGDRSTANDTG